MCFFPPFLAPGLFPSLSEDRKPFRTKSAEIPAGMAGYNSLSCSRGLLGAMEIWARRTLRGFSGHCAGLEAKGRIPALGIPAFPEQPSQHSPLFTCSGTMGSGNALWELCPSYSRLFPALQLFFPRLDPSPLRGPTSQKDREFPNGVFPTIETLRVFPGLLESGHSVPGSAFREELCPLTNPCWI